jgi:hypothetical protein
MSQYITYEPTSLLVTGKTGSVNTSLPNMYNTFFIIRSNTLQVIGNNNSAYGVGSLIDNNNNENSAYGSYVLSNNNALYNCGYGYAVLYNNFYSSSNTACGGLTLYVNYSTNVLQGMNNTALGFKALRNNISGSNNICIGYQEYIYGPYTYGPPNMSDNISLGCHTSNVTFTNLSNTITFGTNSVPSANNQIILGVNGIRTTSYGPITNVSDYNDKTEINNTILSTNFIQSLRPVDYKYDYRSDYIKTNKDNIDNIIRDGTFKRNRFHHGFIAQEVKQVCNNLNIDFGGYKDHTINNGLNMKTIGYNEFIGPIVKTLQEMLDQIDILKNKKNELYNKINIFKKNFL